MQVGELNSKNFPALKSIGELGFSECPITSVCLPNLISIGQGGFSDCQSLRHFSAEKLEQVANNCFSICSLLSSIYCNLDPIQFVCEVAEAIGCGQCPICTGALPQCLKKGRQDQMIEFGHMCRRQNLHLTCEFQLSEHKLRLQEEIQEVEIEFLILRQKLENTLKLGGQ